MILCFAPRIDKYELNNKFNHREQGNQFERAVRRLGWAFLLLANVLVR